MKVGFEKKIQPVKFESQLYSLEVIVDVSDEDGSDIDKLYNEVQDKVQGAIVSRIKREKEKS